VKYPQPFVKWAGGKAQLIPRISRLVPRNFDCYFEPFIGGGALFFHQGPKRSFISDANFELMNAYRVIKDHPASLIDELSNIQEKRISARLFKKYRSLDPETLTSARRAARFVFLNKTCFNGLYRVNRRGSFNVPFGKYTRMPRLFESDNIIAIQKLLQNAEIMCASYEIPLQRAKKGDFVYLDPPYSPEPEVPSFTSYTKESFSTADQRRLAQKFKELDRRGCFLMLSNSNTKLVRELYADYQGNIFELTADRMINCIGSERRGYSELVVLNYVPPMETLIPWVKQAG